MGQKTVHVHIPYPMLLERLEDVLREEISPELYIDGDNLRNADPGVLKDIREKLTQKGLSLTMHGPYLELNPGSMNEDTRLKTAEMYRHAFRAAGILKPRTMVLHAGYSEKKYKGDKDLWMAQSMKTWPEFVLEAERTGVVIAIEHVFEKEPSTLKALLEKISSPNVGACVDTGHIHAFSGSDMEAWLSALGPWVKEVHLHDNSGEHDEHLPLGEGIIDFQRFFTLLKKYASEPVYTIEPHGEEMVKRGIKAVKKYIG